MVNAWRISRKVSLQYSRLVYSTHHLNLRLDGQRDQLEKNKVRMTFCTRIWLADYCAADLLIRSSSIWRDFKFSRRSTPRFPYAFDMTQLSIGKLLADFEGSKLKAINSTMPCSLSPTMITRCAKPAEQILFHSYRPKFAGTYPGKGGRGE